MLIEKLRRRENFSPSETALAAFILNYGEEISYLSIHDLAEMTYTSTTTIRRLCTKTGCTGFRDFKIKLLKEITADKEETVDVNHPFHFGAQPSLIAANLEKLLTNAIHSTISSLDYNKINKAVDLIRQADIILLYGNGDSGITARVFMNRLIKVRKACILASEYGEETVYSLLATKRSLGIFISYRGGDLNTTMCANMLRKNGVPYISLSSEIDTPLTQNADVKLTIPSYEQQADNIATFYSQECFACILNVIYSVLYSRSYQENRQRKKLVDSMTASGQEGLLEQ